VWWVRRDLRLADNPALAAALACGNRVIPVFVFDSTLLARHAAAIKRIAFLFAGLRALDADLRARSGRLVLFQGDPADVLPGLAAGYGADAFFAEADFTPYALRRDARVAERVRLHLVGGPVVHPPDAAPILKADGTPYIVFTPFGRRWQALAPPVRGDLLAPPRRVPTPEGPEGLPLPEKPVLPAAVPFPPGEAEARRRLDAFTRGDEPPIYRYAGARDRLDLDGTSRLSPYLRFGMLSARQAVVRALEAIDRAPDDRAREGARTWLNELIWREFYVHVLYHFPHVLERSFRPALEDVPWEDDESAYAAWRDGRTGYPVVDAAMRQLVQTGWMHNRARMIVASFLVKDLLIDWRHGERFFMQHLVDHDPAANNGGWQWAAGTGTDAAPYFRVFNPTLQGRKHDAGGAYVRRWVEELARVPDRFVHRPWEMGPGVQQEVGCVVGRDYPAPIIEHAAARDRALAAYGRAREGG
jgi:deoxyribodipyrimidine photo-lyase